MLSLRPRRTGGALRGQSTVEFALTAPIFFVIFFGIVNGGTLLYSRNAIQHAADVGASQIAALGNSSTSVDSNAILAMESAGLSTALLTNVTGITVQEEDAATGSSGETLTPDTTGCGASGAGTGYPCEMQYTESNGVWSCTGTCNWPPSNRSTTQTSGLTGDPAFALLQVFYTFRVIGGFATFHLTTSVVFRLEPQSL